MDLVDRRRPASTGPAVRSTESGVTVGGRRLLGEGESRPISSRIASSISRSSIGHRRIVSSTRSRSAAVIRVIASIGSSDGASSTSVLIAGHRGCAAWWCRCLDLHAERVEEEAEVLDHVVGLALRIDGHVRGRAAASRAYRSRCRRARSDDRPVGRHGRVHCTGGRPSVAVTSRRTAAAPSDARDVRAPRS